MAPINASHIKQTCYRHYSRFVAQYAGHVTRKQYIKAVALYIAILAAEVNGIDLLEPVETADVLEGLYYCVIA